jgi:hypothetical protein
MMDRRLPFPISASHQLSASGRVGSVQGIAHPVADVKLSIERQAKKKGKSKTLEASEG